MRKITDEEAYKHYKKYVVDAMIKDGKDPEKMLRVTLDGDSPVKMSDVFKHVNIEITEIRKDKKLKGSKKKHAVNTRKIDSVGKKELDKQKEWMRYKISKGIMK